MNPSLLAYFKHLIGFDISMAVDFYENCLAATTQFYCLDMSGDNLMTAVSKTGINATCVYSEIVDVVNGMLADNPESIQIREFKAVIKAWVESDLIRRSFEAAEKGKYTYDQTINWGNWSFDICYWPVSEVIHLHGKDIPLIAEDVVEMSRILKELEG